VPLAVAPEEQGSPARVPQAATGSTTGSLLPVSGSGPGRRACQ